MHPPIGAVFLMRTSISQPRTQEIHIKQKWLLAHLLSHICPTKGAKKESWAEHSPGTSPSHMQGDVKKLMIHPLVLQKRGPPLQRKDPTRKLFSLLQAKRDVTHVQPV